MTMNTGAPIQDLGQVAIVVSDVAKAKRFYVDVLGLRPLFDAGPNLSFVTAGSVRLMLTTPEGAGEAGKNSVLYYRTSDVTATYQEVTNRGATPEGPPHRVAKMPDHELWMAFVRDPDGNLVGLMEERR